MNQIGFVFHKSFPNGGVKPWIHPDFHRMSPVNSYHYSFDNGWSVRRVDSVWGDRIMLIKADEVPKKWLMMSLVFGRVVKLIKPSPKN